MNAMTVAGLAALAIALAGALVLAARAHLLPSAFLVTFDTTASRAKNGWAAFWARDPFIAAQRKRSGPAFATYDIPGGNRLAVHFAEGDLRQHTLVLGATGAGKSSLLEALAVHRLRVGAPFALIDLHGDLFERVAAWARARGTRVTTIDFTKPDALPSFNPLVPLAGIDPGRQVDLIVATLKRLYASEEAKSWAWGVKVEELMRHALLAIIEARIRGVMFSLADLPQFFLIGEVRKGIVAHASPTSRVYFTKRYGAREEMYVSAVLNKIEPFLGSIAVQRFLGRSDSTVDLFGAIDRGETILINLAKGYMPSADIMGRLLMNVFQTATLRRERLRPDARRPYSILLDEAHLLAGAGSGLEDFLVAARKYRVFVTLAAQGLSLFPPSFRPHLLGNTGRQFFFRMPYSEARVLAKDIFEAQGTIYREQTRPNEAIHEPLLDAAEELAWRIGDLSSLPVGVAYWMQRDRPYKARRIKILPPMAVPIGRVKAEQKVAHAQDTTQTPQ
jgi:type IV secretory pathway TraG/TraD family ATPase VirD4